VYKTPFFFLYIMYRSLDKLEEVVGIPKKIIVEEDKIIIYFENTMGISIDSTQHLKKYLQEKKGKKIGILRTGIDEKPYVLRDAEEHK